MQDKNFIKSIFRNGPSDLQIRKPAALLSGNGANRIIFLSTPITTGNIFSRKKLLIRPCQISFHFHFLFSDSGSSLETAAPDIRSIRANRSIRSNNSNVQMQINSISIEIDSSVSEEFLCKLIRAVCHA